MEFAEYERLTRREMIKKGVKRRWAERRVEEIEEWKQKTGQTELRAFVDDERR